MEAYFELTSQQQANKVIDSINALRFTRALHDAHIPVVMNGFRVDIYRRQTSSEKAKKFSYAYRANITFNYGPERKQMVVGFPTGENRSLKKLIETNRDYLKSRLRQHFELDVIQVQLKLRLAGWE